jgi:guanosine-3',5'-bis(diphosphate) 3'-pyrophosphohydrolase
LFEKELKKSNYTAAQLMKQEWIEPIFKKYSFHNVDDMYAGIALGALTAGKIISKLKEEYRHSLPPEEQTSILLEQIEKENKKKKKSVPESGIVVKGIDNCLVRLSRCCNPVPGDPIVGYITRGRGVSVHRQDCSNVKNNLIDGDARLIDVSWYKHSSPAVSYMAEITVKAHDRPGLLLELTNVIGETRIPLRGINARTLKDLSVLMHLTLEITNTEQLDRIINRISCIRDVYEISRNR